MYKLVWSNGGMIPTVKHQRTRRRACRSVTIFRKFPTEWRGSKPDKVRSQQSIAWGMAQAFTVPTGLQHNTFPLHFCASDWPGACKLPITDPPPAQYHWPTNIYQVRSQKLSNVKLKSLSFHICKWEVWHEILRGTSTILPVASHGSLQSLQATAGMVPGIWKTLLPSNCLLIYCSLNTLSFYTLLCWQYQ